MILPVLSNLQDCENLSAAYNFCDEYYFRDPHVLRKVIANPS